MYYYILNPSAGSGTINAIQDKLRSRLDELGIGGEFAKTTGPGDATKMAAAAITKGFNTIIAVGGDGTVNEVINGITRDKIAVGIIPIGSNNKLANHLGINGWQQACEVLAARRLIGYNLMAAGQHYFLSECLVNSAVPVDERKGKSRPEPGSTAELEPGSLRPKNQALCRLRIDEKYELESPYSSLTVVNQKFNNPLLDNKLLITITETTSQPSFFNRLLKRHNGRQPAIAVSRIQANRVNLDTTPSSQVTLDGKEATETPILIKLTDRQIRFISEKQST